MMRDGSPPLLQFVCKGEMTILHFSLYSNAFGISVCDFENPRGTVHENITCV